MQPLLNIKNLSFAFGKRSVLTEVCAEINAGECLRVAGQNGSGKSTLLRVVVGLLQASSGEARFSAKNSFFYLPSESNGLFLDLSATENLKFALEMRGVSASKIDLRAELLQWSGFTPFGAEFKKCRELSTGTKRKISLTALDLAHKPLWLLDEPVLGLDAHSCEKFAAILKKHIDQGGACCVVTHDDRMLQGVPLKTLDLGEAK